MQYFSWEPGTAPVPSSETAFIAGMMVTPAFSSYVLTNAAAEAHLAATHADRGFLVREVSNALVLRTSSSAVPVEPIDCTAGSGGGGSAGTYAAIKERDPLLTRLTAIASEDPVLAASLAATGLAVGLLTS